MPQEPARASHSRSSSSSTRLVKPTKMVTARPNPVNSNGRATVMYTRQLRWPNTSPLSSRAQPATQKVVRAAAASNPIVHLVLGQRRTASFVLSARSFSPRLRQ